MNIYVGNLSYNVTEGEIRNAFEDHGSVASVKVITDKFTGKSKGFGFVEMEDDTDAQSAIDALNDYELGGRRLKVNQARPRTNDDYRSGPPRRDRY